MMKIIFTESDEGVYINTNIAYYYNIEIGDTLELELNVPICHD